MPSLEVKQLREYVPLIASITWAFSLFERLAGSTPGSFFTSSTTWRMRSFSSWSSRTIRLSSPASSGSEPASARGPGSITSSLVMSAPIPSST